MISGNISLPAFSPSHLTSTQSTFCQAPQQDERYLLMSTRKEGEGQIEASMILSTWKDCDPDCAWAPDSVLLGGYQSGERGNVCPTLTDEGCSTYLRTMILTPTDRHLKAIWNETQHPCTNAPLWI